MNFAVFVKNKLGNNYELLNELSLDISRGKEYHQAMNSGEAAKHYKSEFERMQSLRSNGETGRLEFVGLI
jgi:hypothetical protein